MKRVFIAVSLLALGSSLSLSQGFVPARVWRRVAAIERQAASLAKSIATQDSDGHTIYVKVGGRLEVYLPASMGTGYGWHVAAIDHKILEQQGLPTLGELNPNRGMGRDQMEIFVFAVKASGTSALRLEYNRPWQKDQPSRTWGITVVAR